MMNSDASRRLDDGGSVYCFLGLLHVHHLTLSLKVKYVPSNRPHIRRKKRIRVIQGLENFRYSRRGTLELNPTLSTNPELSR